MHLIIILIVLVLEHERINKVNDRSRKSFALAIMGLQESYIFLGIPCIF